MANVPKDPSDRTPEDVFYPADRVPFVEWDEFSGAKQSPAWRG